MRIPASNRTRSALFAGFLLLLGVAGFLVFADPFDSSPQKTRQTAATTAGAADGRLNYDELTRALKARELRFLQLHPDGRAGLLFRDGSKADSVFPPGELRAIASRAVGQGKSVEIVPMEPPDSGGIFGSAFPLDIELPYLLAALAIIAVISFAYDWKVRKARRSARDSLPEKEEPAEDSRESVSFSDIAGCDEAVEEIREFVEFICDRERFERVGARMPSGALLHGPPGTGKTMLARALAFEGGVPFFYLAGSDAVNKYVGTGAARIRSLFARARMSPEGAVVFIDEIDAIGRQRSGTEAVSSQEYDQTLNQLLVELDGFEGREGVVVIGATNRIDTIDPALLRPGRLSRRIEVLPPAEKGRREILEIYTKDKPLAGDVDLDGLARITAGSTGADLADMVNEAAIQAAREGRLEISEADLREGHLRALAGPARLASPRRPEEERKIAYHEAGHVLCAELSPDHEKAQRVSIVGRGQAAGLAVYGREDRALHSPEYVRQQLVCVLGGRAAERLVFGTVSSGAANDLQQADELSRRAIEEWGMSRLTGQLRSRRSREISDRTRSLVDQEVEEMVAEAFEEALRLLAGQRDALDSLARLLLAEKTLERVDIRSAVDGRITSSRPKPSRRSDNTPAKTRTARKRQAGTRRRPPALAALLFRLPGRRRAEQDPSKAT